MALFEDMTLPGVHDGSGDELFASGYVDASILNSPHQAHPLTVSPSEIFDDFGITSAPASTAFPPLDTPQLSYMGSTSSSFEPTPLDGYLDIDLDGEADPTMFPDLESFGEPLVAQNSFGLLTDLHSAPAPSPMVRQKSSPGRPPIVHDRKASLSAGIAKAYQKPRKDLPEITVDNEDDSVTAKRKKNTAAARKSRARKQETMSAMAAEIARLRAIVASLGADPDEEL
ncbi:hypothetical protein BT93_L5612 [Corymbia citriodora subsp. variegata]|uniref:BZIP domain-containing protein n=1 Tax=Corymbia citriodora subsp. variegata TaxID=360336 RepID=A0A8T0CF01_CORYI|nr:hypothetical protein BT93_L5612 [Corymbia citriodora subsp. variegata]